MERKFNKGLNVLLDSGDIHQAFGVYRGNRILKVGKVTVLPYTKAIEMVFRGILKFHKSKRIYTIRFKF